MTLFLSNECKKFLQNPSDDYRFCLEEQSAEKTYTLSVYQHRSSSAHDKKICDLDTIVTKVRNNTFHDDKRIVDAFYHELSRRVTLYRSLHPNKPCGRLVLFQDIPLDICKVIANKLSLRDSLRFLSTSKRTYTINSLSIHNVSKIISKYYATPEREKKQSHIVHEFLKCDDFPLKLSINIDHISALLPQIIKKSISIQLSTHLKMDTGKYLSIINSLDTSILTKIKALRTPVKCTAQGLIALLEKCPSLEELDISGYSRIADLDLSTLRDRATKIKTIKADHSSLTSQGFTALFEKCPDLESLDISECKNIADLDFSHFTLIATKIKKIRAYNSSLTTQGLIALLEKCPDLEELDINHCTDIRDFDFSHSTLTATKLKKLKASLLPLTSQGFIALLENCPDLEELDINNCQEIRDFDFSHSTLTATKLKKLKAILRSLTSQGFIALLEKCPDLEELDISYYKNIADLNFSHSTLISTKIKKITASLSSLTSQGLIALLEKCPDLEELNIRHCNNIADLDFSHSTLISTKIKTINAYDSSLTSQGLIALLEKCPYLEVLNISECKNIADLDFSHSTLISTKIKKIRADKSSLTSQGLIALLEKCPYLEWLTISYCENITLYDLSSLNRTKIKIFGEGLSDGLTKKFIEDMRNLSISKKISNCCEIL